VHAVIAVVLAAITGSLAACGSGPTCLLEDVITDRVGAQELHDCGTAEVVGQMMTPVADATAIHDCVIADQGALVPFRAEIRAESEDGTVAAAFVGLTEGGVWRTYAFGFNSNPTGEEEDPRTGTSSCTAISEQTPCDNMYLYSNLCLICEGAQPAATCPAPE
jgi:hypothetical protein